MRQKMVIGLRDVKVGEYTAVFPLRSELEAQRVFLEGVENANSPLGRFPRDYQIHLIGMFDPETGAIVPEVPVRDVTPYSGLDELIGKRGGSNAKQ